MFIVRLIQNGGCDYTIGCGEVVILLPKEITTMPQAIDFVSVTDGEVSRHEAQLGYYGDRVDEAVVYEVSEAVHLDVGALRDADEARERQAEAARQAAKELAELERLKKKYEGK
jgi:hypothetical protein